MNYGMDYQGGSSSGGFGASGFSMENSQGSGGKGSGRKNYDEQTIQPCTVSMILRARPEPDNSLELPDGRKVHHVVFVGAIKEYTENSTNIIYEVEDGTGIIEVKQWVDQNDSAAKLEMRQICMKENIYVKIVALPKHYDGNIQLVAESIRPVVSGNELSCHLLDVVYAGERLKNRSMFVAPQASLLSSSTIGAVGRQLQKASDRDVKDAVANFIRVEGNKSDLGAEIAKCVSVLGGQYGEHAVRKVIDELAAEGLIYSTATEEYYKYAIHY